MKRLIILAAATAALALLALGANRFAAPHSVIHVVTILWKEDSTPEQQQAALEGVTSTLTELKFDVGKEFDVITVSIDPRDMPAEAAAKKEKYIKRYGRFGAASGWHFLTGPESAIHRLTDAAGFHYAYDSERDQFAHGATILVLTPQGRISRYLYGFEYKARDLRLALVEASENRIGTTTDQLLLLCYHYDPATGKYSRTAMNVVRAGGIVTVCGLAGFIIVMLRRERWRRRLGWRTSF